MAAQTDALLAELRETGVRLAGLLSPALSKDVPRSLTDAALLTFVREIEALGRLIDAARGIAAGEVDQRSRPERGPARLCEAFGCGSSVELLTRLTSVRTATARQRIRAARPLTSTTSLTGDRVPAPFPRLRSALDAGQVGLDTVQAITSTLGPIAERCHPGDLAAAEDALVSAAIGSDASRSDAGASDAPALDADTTALQARVWALALDPDGVLPEYERASRRRALTLGRIRDGLVPLRGDLLPDVAAQLQQLIHAHLSPRVADRTGGLANGPVFTDASDAAHASLPDDIAPLDDGRTRAQKQHDVLAAVLGVAARAADTPSLGGAAPTLLVTIAASELEAHNGVAFIDGTDQPIPAFVARHIACCGGIQRVVIDDSGRVIELGSPQRGFTAHQRRAIIARDGGCVIPGCHVPAAWCEVHHAVEHAKGGPTHIDNGMLLCFHHHRTLETNGWAVRMLAGLPQVRAPLHFDRSGRWRPAGRSAHLQHRQLTHRGAG